MPEISKIKLTSGDEYDIKDTTAREMISSHTHTNESMGFGYGICYTEEPDTNKTVSISGYILSAGGMVSIKFTDTVPADSTLNINNTGDKPIYHNGSAIAGGIINAKDTATFIYDGTNYNLIATNNITNVSMGFGYGECSTAAAKTVKTVSMSGYKLTKGGMASIRFFYDVPANATLNINSTGVKSIYYNGSAITDDIIKAGDTATFIYNGTNYNLIATNNISNESMGFGYGICDTAASTKAKTVSISNYKLANDSIVSIKFEYNVPAAATLNINSTGARDICYNGYPMTSSIIKAGDTATFIYNGVYNLIAINNISNESMGFGYGICGTAAATTAKTVSISNYKLTTGGIASIKFNNDVPANATLNINGKGAKSIYYNGAAITDGIIKAGDTATFIYDGTNYNLISLDRDFNKKETGTLSCSLISHLNRYDIDDSNFTYNLTGTYIKYNDLVRIYISLEINNLVVMTNNNNITYYIMSFNTNLPLPDSTISERFNLNINDFSAFDYNDETKTINFKSNSYHNIKWIGYIKSGKITLCLIAKNPDGSCSNFKLNISGEYPI